MPDSSISYVKCFHILRADPAKHIDFSSRKNAHKGIPSQHTPALTNPKSWLCHQTFQHKTVLHISSYTHVEKVNKTSTYQAFWVSSQGQKWISLSAPLSTQETKQNGKSWGWARNTVHWNQATDSPAAQIPVFMHTEMSCHWLTHRIQPCKHLKFKLSTTRLHQLLESDHWEQLISCSTHHYNPCKAWSAHHIDEPQH